MGSDETLKPGPLPEGFEPMSDRQIVKNRRVADAIGENNVRRYTWKRASKEQESRGWAATVTLTMESAVQHGDSDMLAGFVNVAAEVLTYALDSVRFERARAKAAEQRAEAWRRFAQEVASDVHPIGADPLGDITTDFLPVLLDITRRAAQQHGAATARAEAAEQRAAAAEAEVAQARAEGAAAERARIAADLREWAEQGGDPWMAHVADEVAAERRPGGDQ